MLYHQCFSALSYNMPSDRSKEMRKVWNWAGHRRFVSRY